MQKLYFEPAWDRTIAPADREKMMRYFQQQIKQLDNGVHFSFLWNARNYKDEHLITVLIHNCEEFPLYIRNTTIAYYEQGKQLANAKFNLPCEIAGNTSMPWTFIFSKANKTTDDPQFMIWS